MIISTKKSQVLKFNFLILFLNSFFQIFPVLPPRAVPAVLPVQGPPRPSRRRRRKRPFEAARMRRKRAEGLPGPAALEQHDTGAEDEQEGAVGQQVNASKMFFFGGGEGNKWGILNF